MTNRVGATGDPDHLFVGDTELAVLMREFDWSSTPLGPPAQWPESLKTSVRIMLTSRQPIWIGWGPDLTYLYNTPYKSIIGGKHPWALGKPASLVWREIWDDIGPMLETAMKGAEGTYVEAQLLIMERNGYPEETHYTFSYSPIPGGDGTTGGIFCANTDDTQRVINERQLALLRELSTGTMDTRNPEQACEKAALALGTDSRDLPFAMIYLLEPGSRTARLAGVSGIPSDHPSAPATLSLDASSPWPIGEVQTSREPYLVTDLSARFAEPFPCGAWSQPPKDAIILPIEASGFTGSQGFLIAGLNPFRLFDDNYSSFLDLIARQIAASHARHETTRLLGEETQILELLNRVGATVAAEIDLERAVQTVTDTATELSGAAFGSFFYNVVDATGESYTLYTLSGVPREAFSKFPMPRNTAVFAPTFNGEGIVRSDDITQDPRFGKNDPYYGMPKGHLPVRSYLAAPVMSRRGEVLGGLFFGHPEVGIFDARAERIVAAIAVQAAIAMDKAKLYRAAQDELALRRETEAALRESERTLEAKVGERTAELAAANAKLIKQAEEREQTEGRFQHLVEGVTDYALFMLDPSGIVTNWNTGAERIKGYRAEEIVGQHFERFYTIEDRTTNLPARALEQARREGKFEQEGQRVRKDGSRFWASVVINAIRNRQGDLIGFAKITRDVTERHLAQEALQRAQEQLVQAQKMEGIGQLTGGVAHDFNNLLTIIIGNLESLERAVNRLPAGYEGLLRPIDHAMRGAQRAASLTQHLLAFARRQPLDPKPFDVGRLVTGMSELLRRTLGEQIAIESVLAGGLWRVHVDPNQLEVAILNLAVNARDAMSGGGKLTIETANTYLDEIYAATQSEVVPGQYVAISITDTGMGMPPEVQRHAFEPFYTTKDIGQGTGLGLSQVYGFVKQSGGHVKIYSEVGEGTTVKLYLPRLHSDDSSIADELNEPAPRAGSGQLILAVEDDHDVRAYTCGILRELGYVVLEAETGAAGLQMLERYPEIALLFTDVGLPGGMNGRQLADEARKIRPDLKVLFTTGYARNAIVHDGRLDPGVVLLPKPFTYAGLGAKLNDLLLDSSHIRRVLLVEDNELVQELAVEYLQDMGYRPQPASTAVEALNKMRLMNGGVDFAVIDIGLPDRRGDVLIGELRALYPQLPIIIASGDGEAVFHKRLAEDKRIALLRKPYTQDGLKAAIASLQPKPPEPT